MQMFSKSLFVKFTVGVGIVILVCTMAVILALTSWTSRNIHDEANKQVVDHLTAAARLLRVTDSIMRARVKSAMALLKHRGNDLGKPELGQSVMLQGKSVPELLLGQQSQVQNYSLVDSVTAIEGGTATLFVKRGDDFVRIATNVMHNGKRAIGTLLDPHGRAIAAIRQGRDFLGQVDILGSPYLTAYSPIRNSQGVTIGIWYVGYKADLRALENAIDTSHIMKRGVVALVDDHNRIRMHTTGADMATLKQLVHSDIPGWNIHRENFTPWNYSLVAAYPEAEVNASIRQEIITVLLAGLGLCVLLGTAIAWMFRRQILRPLRQGVELAVHIADGKLDNELPPRSHDEIGRLISALEQMQLSIRLSLTDIANASGQVNEAVLSLNEMAGETVKAVNAQRASTDDVATAMTQMSATVVEVARNAAETAAAARRADDEASRGLTVVEAANESSRQLAQKIEQAGNSMQRLANDSQKIGVVLDVIRGIAEQTNLLALNAAIEAARAGTHGRGFAVVADEVRTLASRAQASTDEIQTMIEQLQSASAEATQSVSEGQMLVSENVERSDEVAQALHAIARGIASLNDMNTQIASAAEQQSTVADDVHRNVERITQMANITDENATSAAAAAEQLAGLADNLRGMTVNYRL